MPKSIEAPVRRECGLFQRILDRPCLIRTFPPAPIASYKQEIFRRASVRELLEEIRCARLQYDRASSGLSDVYSRSFSAGIEMRKRGLRPTHRIVPPSGRPQFRNEIGLMRQTQPPPSPPPDQSKSPAPNTTASNLSVLSAIDGDNCPFNPDDKGQVDVTALMAEFCKKEPPGLCRYPIQKWVLGDPSKGCAKSFRVRYACRRRGPSALHGKRTSCRQPKNGSVFRSSGEQPPATVQLNCPPPQV